MAKEKKKLDKDLGNLTGVQKAAIFMLALDQEHSGMLFTLMEDDEIRELSQTMATLGVVSSRVIEKLFMDLLLEQTYGNRWMKF